MRVFSKKHISTGRLVKNEKKEFAVAVVTLEGEFAVLLYHIWTKEMDTTIQQQPFFARAKTQGKNIALREYQITSQSCLG